MKMDTPNEIIIELTEKCNLDCDFCFNKQNNNHSADISKGDVFNILGDMVSSGIESVRFTGGEPFLRGDLIEILKKAKSLGLYVILNTNALLINEKNKVCFNYVDLVLFSLHNISKFQEVKEKISLLKDYKSKIMLATITTKANINDLEVFYMFISNINQGNFVDWFLLRQIPNKFNEKPISKQDIDELCSSMIRYNQKYNLNIKVANSLPFCVVNKDISSICRGGLFDSGHTRLFIDCKGNYRTDYFSDVLGNITNKKVMGVWNSEELMAIRGYKNVQEWCKKCYHLKKCRGGLNDKEYLYDFDNVKYLASVIIPTFNDSKRLSLLINSLENQTCNNFEIIVVDDGSTDDTKEVVEQLKKKSGLEISYFYLNNTNIFGAGIARNFGAKQARGDILVFLDQDNVAHPKLIENYLNEQEKNDVVLGYYAGYGNNKYHYDFEKLKKFVEGNKIIETIIPEFREKIFKNSESYRNEEWKYFVSANFSIKKELFFKFQFDEKIIKWGGEDIDLGYRLIKDQYNIFFSKNCISFNSSDLPMFNPQKFISTTEGLIYLYCKYNTKEMKDYCFERFYHTHTKYRGNAKLDFMEGSFCFKKSTHYTDSTGETSIYINDQNKAIIYLGFEINKLKNKIKHLSGLIGSVKFDLNILSKLDDSIYKEFRDTFLDIIKILKQYEIEIDLNDIRMQSLKHKRLLLAPRELSIELGTRCNVQCSYCWINSPLLKKNTKNIGEIDYGKIIGVIDDSYNMGTGEIRVSSYGEPLLSKDAKKLIKYIAKKGLDLTLLTNGILIDEEILGLLDSIKKATLLINLPAITEEKYGLICRSTPENFHKVLNNLKLLSSLKQRKKNKNEQLNIQLVYVINKHNYLDMSDYILLAKEYCIDSILFKAANLYDELESVRVPQGGTEKHKLELYKTKKISIKHNITTNIDEIIAALQNPKFTKMNNVQDLPNLLTNKCYNAWFFGRVNCLGDYYICCRTTCSFGNIKDYSLKEILGSERIQKTIHEGISGINLTKKMWSVCNHCYHPENNLLAYNYLNAPLENEAKLNFPQKRNAGTTDTFCPGLWDQIFVDKNGDVHNCCHSSSQSIGNIYRDSLKNICNSGEAQELRKKSLMGNLDCYKNCTLNINKNIPPPNSLKINYDNLKRIKILFSERCNINCLMCWQDSNNKGCLDYKKLIGNVDITPFEYIELQGGEPLFIEDAKRYFDYVVSQGKMVSFLTNGLLINGEWAKKIALGSSFIHISLNAATKETHEAINRGSKWETVINSIQKLRYYKEKYHTNLKILGHMTIVIENLHEVPLFIRDFKKLGLDAIEFSYDFRTNNHLSNYLRINARKKIGVRSAIKSALRESRNLPQIDLFDLRKIGLV